MTMTKLNLYRVAIGSAGVGFILALAVGLRREFLVPIGLITSAAALDFGRRWRDAHGIRSEPRRHWWEIK